MHLALTTWCAVATTEVTIATATVIVVPTAAVAVVAATATLLALLSAAWAAGRLVGEALLRVEFLLAGGENELRATIPARQRLVCKAHCLLFLQKLMV